MSHGRSIAFYHRRTCPRTRTPRLPFRRLRLLDIYRSINPYSEAAFKTLKYCPAFPGDFASIYDARVFVNAFFDYYNTEHRHSGIGLYTPGSVHDGTWKYVRDARQIVLDAAYAVHPERFHQGPPRAPELPSRVWINQPPAKIETQEDHPTT